jgi:hypothetical protein
MASPFTYLARDLLSWNALDSLPYQGVQFGKVLDQHGPWAGSLPLADPNVQKFDWKDATRTARTALFVDLQGTLVWGGIVWTTGYDSDDPTHSLKVGATEFGSFFQHRLQAQDYGSESVVGKLWEETGENPMEIIKRIITDAQTKEAEGPGYVTAAKIPIVIHGEVSAEDKVKTSYPATSLQTIDSINSTLTQIGFAAGYDYSWDVAYKAGTKIPTVQLNLWYPIKGRTAEESGIVILGRDTVKWSYPEDGTQMADAVTETGGTGVIPVTASELVPVTGNHEATGAYGEPITTASGYPLLEKANSRTQITTEQLLAKIALGDLALCFYPVVTPSIVLPASLPETPARNRQTLALGEFDIGDQLVFRIDPMAGGGPNTDPRFPEGMEYTWRITQWTCVPADKGLSTVQLDLGMPPLHFIPPEPPPH